MIDKQFNPAISSSCYIARNLLLKSVKRNAYLLYGRMLDFGCGSKPYKTLIKVDQYIGLDFNGQGHSHEGEEIDYYYDGKSIPFAAGEFDSILTTEVFEHVFNLEDVIGELHRVLKSRGLILITMPFIIAQHEMPTDCVRYTCPGLINLLTKNGFTVLRYENLGTSIQAQKQMFMSYLDSYVISKFKRVGLYKPVAAITFTALNLWTMFLNWLLPKRHDAFLNHVVICIKNN
jgi:SAM-dependent methyltransferase